MFVNYFRSNGRFGDIKRSQSDDGLYTHFSLFHPLTHTDTIQMRVYIMNDDDKWNEVVIIAM